MSFILDALRKSERARRALGAAPADVPLDARIGKPRQTWFAIVAILLLANVALLAYFLLNEDAPAPVAEWAQDAASTTPAASVSRAPDRDVRSLATEAGVDPASPDAVASPADAGTPEVAAPGAIAPDVATPAAPSSATGLPVLAALPPSIAGRLPALHVDVHSYAADPKKRFVLVNLKRYGEGERLAEGPLLVEIVPEGVVLEFEGARFLLPRG